VGSAPAGVSAVAVSTCTPPPAAPDPALPAPRPAVVSYSVPSSTGVTKTAATLLATVDTAGSAGQAAFELGDATAGVRCTAVQPLAAVTGPQPVTVKLRSEKPGTTMHFRLVVTTAAGQVVGADQAFTTVANPTRLAPGTTMLGIGVGYLTPEQARARVLARFARPVVFTWQGKRWKATPKQLGATADVDGRSTAPWRAWGAVDGRSRSRSPSTRPRWSATSTTSTASTPGRRRSGASPGSGRKAKLVEPLTARAVQKQRMESVITRSLKSATRPPIELPPDRDEARGARPAVHRRPARGAVAQRSTRTAPSFSERRSRPGGRRCRRPSGATTSPGGAARTPSSHRGRRGIRTTYPPAHVRWAMYFFDNDFLHDSYEPAGAYGKGSNYGPYASHGCVHVPAGVMQVLYTTVRITRR